MPSRMAATRVKALNDEPGWRMPWVARFTWFLEKSLPPTMALM